jgi:hypothetical protein
VRANCSGGWSLWHLEVDRGTVDDLVGWIGKLDENLVRPCGKPLDDERLTARIDPVPGRFIHSDVQVPDTGRNIESSRSEDRYDSQVFCPVPDDDKSPRQLLG